MKLKTCAGNKKIIYARVVTMGSGGVVMSPVGAIKLKSYLLAHEITYAQFGSMVGVGEQSVYNWCAGRKKPTRHFDEITAATGGEVKARDFY